MSTLNVHNPVKWSKRQFLWNFCWIMEWPTKSFSSSMYQKFLHLFKTVIYNQKLRMERKDGCVTVSVLTCSVLITGPWYEHFINNSFIAFWCVISCEFYTFLSYPMVTLCLILHRVYLIVYPGICYLQQFPM